MAKIGWPVSGAGQKTKKVLMRENLPDLLPI
jgi:hypothetical protein